MKIPKEVRQVKRIVDLEEYRRARAEGEASEMTKKQYLRQYKSVLGRIESKLEEIERLDNALYPGAQIISDTPRSGKKTDGSERNDRAIDIVRRMRGRMCAELRELEKLREEIAGTINSVPSQQLRELLERRYINFQSWEQIAEAMGYGIDNIYKMHGNALKQLKIREEGKTA